MWAVGGTASPPRIFRTSGMICSPYFSGKKPTEPMRHESG
jgi:hypothetical protein